MKLPIGVKSLSLPNGEGNVILIPEGMDKTILKSILTSQKNKVIIIGNTIGRVIFEDYKKKAKLMEKFREFSETKVEMSA